VTETLHGVTVTDPYRWLEDQNSPRTREWISEQTSYARAHLDAIPGRNLIRERIEELLDVPTYDSVQKVGNRYFFRKRLPREEQPSIYMREGKDGEDRLLIDPRERGRGNHVAVQPRYASPDGKLLLYEVKEGGERTGTFALLDIEERKTLPDALPRGYLRGFALAPDKKSFYYVHEPSESDRRFYRAARQHELGTSFSKDREIFFAGEDPRHRLILFSDRLQLGVLLCKFLDKTYTDFQVRSFSGDSFEPVLLNADYRFEPFLANDRILALTNLDAPNLRIVELLQVNGGQARFLEVIPETDAAIDRWAVVGDSIFVSYNKQTKIEVRHFSLAGADRGRLPVKDDSTIRLSPGHIDSDELIAEEESFTEPITISCCSPAAGERSIWARKKVRFDSANYSHTQVWYSSKDGTRVPMFLMGRRDVLETGPRHPTIMTSYGGSGTSMTPQFSVFVAYLVERGCLFALPNIRGGSEFGTAWHRAAKGRNRQKAFDDFLSAAEWLIESGRTHPDRLAIFGGSNSGLLVGAALTQRPDLFRAVVCMVPLLDMLRYHLFDTALVWRNEFGTTDDPDDFRVLASYSPYHQVRAGVAYPATMLISGDSDNSCNPLHARKMTARLQAATGCSAPVILDYSKFRGHSPVLPLTERIEALTDRVAFLSEQLQLTV
jgi:prolyl oligopeptidase